MAGSDEDNPEDYPPYELTFEVPGVEQNPRELSQPVIGPHTGTLVLVRPDMKIRVTVEHMEEEETPTEPHLLIKIEKL